jgi:hypothetical protein
MPELIQSNLLDKLVVLRIPDVGKGELILSSAKVGHSPDEAEAEAEAVAGVLLTLGRGLILG